MSETGSALRATSDALLADLQQLEALEHEKRDLEPDDPRLVELAEQVEGISRRVLGRTVRQRQLSAVAHELADAGSAEAPDAPISETPREIHLILADWREAERRAASADSDSAEGHSAALAVDRFREEYRRAQDAATRAR